MPTCCVDPLAIYVYRRREICHFRFSFRIFLPRQEQARAGATALTIDSALELLPADFAVEPAAAGLLVQFDFDRLFVVAEEACEGRWEGFALVRGRRCQQ